MSWKSLSKCMRCVAVLLLLSSSVYADSSVELVLQAGHAGPVTALAYSPDGRILATAGIDSTVKLWDVASQRVARTLLGHRGEVKVLAFSPAGELLASGGEDAHARVWDVASGRLVYDLPIARALRAVVFVGPSQLLVSATLERTELFDLATGKVTRTFANNNFTNALAATRDGRFVLIASDAGIFAWDATSGAQLFKAAGFHAHAVAFSPDGQQALLANEGDVKIVAIPSGKVLRTAKHSDWVSSAAWMPDGRGAVLGGEQKPVQVLDVKTGKLRALAVTSNRIIALSPDGRTVAAPDWLTGSVVLADTVHGATVGALAPQDKVSAVAVASDGLSFAMGSPDGSTHVWSIAQGLSVTQVPSNGLRNVAALAFAPQRPWLAIARIPPSPDVKKAPPGISVWDTATKKVLLETGRGGSQLRFDGDVLSVNYGVTRIDLPSGKLSTKIEQRMGVSADGRFGARLDENSYLTPWNKDARELWVTTSQTGACGGPLVAATAAAFSPDGKRLAASAPSLRLFDFAAKTEVALAPQDTSICSRAIVWKSDNTAFFSGGVTLSFGLNTIPRYPVHRWEAVGKVPKQTWSFPGHNAMVTGVILTADESRVFSGSEDGSARLLDSTTGSELVRLFNLGEDYLAVTPDGYYAGSKGALRQVAFRSGGKLFPFEQFDLQFNRPDLVLPRMGKVSPALVEALHKAYQRRLQRMGFTEDRLARDFHLPELAITTVLPKPTVTEKTLKIGVRASDSLYALERLLVSVNDVPVYGSRGVAVGGNTAEKELSVELSRGGNRIQLSVLNSKGVESLRETLYVTYDAPTSPTKLFVVAIGVSDYVGEEHDLTYAAKDANDIISLFGAAKGFANVEVLKIVDGEATREKILAARALLDKSGVDDTVVLFAAGHGLLDPQNDSFYFATADIDFAAPAKRGVAYEELEGLLDGVAARQKLLLVDACHSGEVEGGPVAAQTPVAGVRFRGFRKASDPLGKVGLDGSFALVRELFADLRRSSGAQVIASAGGGESAFESAAWKNGVFTYALLKGLQSGSADTNKDGAIRVSELRQTVADEVQRLTSGQQKPVARRENLEADFVLWTTAKKK